MNPETRHISFIELKNAHLTVRVHDMPANELLEEIARQGDLTLELNTKLEEKRTIQFYGRSLEDGLRRILTNQSFTLEYDKKLNQSLLNPQSYRSSAEKMGSILSKLSVIARVYTPSQCQ